jgi:integrase
MFSFAVASEMILRSPCRHVWLGAVLGLRWSEVIGLKVKESGSLEQQTPGRARCNTWPTSKLVAGPPKSKAAVRTLAMPQPLVEMLADHLARRGFTASDRDAYVFADAVGGPIHYGNFRTRLSVAMKKSSRVAKFGSPLVAR